MASDLYVQSDHAGTYNVFSDVQLISFNIFVKTNLSARSFLFPQTYCGVYIGSEVIFPYDSRVTASELFPCSQFSIETY